MNILGLSSVESIFSIIGQVRGYFLNTVFINQLAISLSPPLVKKSAYRQKHQSNNKKCKKMSYVTCQESNVMFTCHLSHVTCHLLPVTNTNTNSQVQPANFPTIHRRRVPIIFGLQSLVAASLTSSRGGGLHYKVIFFLYSFNCSNLNKGENKKTNISTDAVKIC